MAHVRKGKIPCSTHSCPPPAVHRGECSVVGDDMHMGKFRIPTTSRPIALHWFWLRLNSGEGSQPQRCLAVPRQKLLIASRPGGTGAGGVRGAGEWWAVRVSFLMGLRLQGWGLIKQEERTGQAVGGKHAQESKQLWVRGMGIRLEFYTHLTATSVNDDDCRRLRIA